MSCPPKPSLGPATPDALGSLPGQALGFSADDIREAIKLGDNDGNGQLDFNEFVTLVTRASSVSHSSASDRPSPVFAEHGWICHGRSRIWNRFKASAIAVACCNTRGR